MERPRAGRDGWREKKDMKHMSKYRNEDKSRQEIEAWVNEVVSHCLKVKR